jgi:hypothetical protein
MEDYVFVNASAKQELSLVNLLVGETRTGKLLYGFFYYAISYFKSAISIRLIGIISLGLFAYLMYRLLSMYQVKSEHAFLLSVLVCTLPSVQILVAWVVCIPYIYSAILSLGAGLLMFKPDLKRSKHSSLHCKGSFIIIIIMLIISMQIYQPTAMLYWASGIIPLLLLKDTDFVKKWHIPFIKFFSAGFIALATYFLSVKILHFVFNTGFVGRGGILEITKIPLKLTWFFYCPLNYALNLWNIFPTYNFAGIIGAVIVGMFLANMLKLLNNENRAKLLRNHILRLFLVTGVLLLSYLPNLIITDTVPPYRTLVSLTIAVCFSFYTGLVNISWVFKFMPGFSEDLRDKIVTVSLIILALISAYHAYTNVHNFALLQANDFNYVKSSISEYGSSDLSGIEEIYVRRYDRTKIIEMGFLYDEFGLPTSAHPWGPANVVRRALVELGIKTDIIINHGAADRPMPKGENILAIDMTKFDYVNTYRSSISESQRYCLTIPTRL